MVTLQVTPEEARILAVLLYDERDALQDCGCEACQFASKQSDHLWETLKDRYIPFPKLH